MPINQKGGCATGATPNTENAQPLFAQHFLTGKLWVSGDGVEIHLPGVHFQPGSAHERGHELLSVPLAGRPTC